MKLPGTVGFYELGLAFKYTKNMNSNSRSTSYTQMPRTSYDVLVSKEWVNWKTTTMNFMVVCTCQTVVPFVKRVS